VTPLASAFSQVKSKAFSSGISCRVTFPLS